MYRILISVWWLSNRLARHGWLVFQTERFVSVCCVGLNAGGLAVVTQATDGVAVVINAVVFGQRETTDMFLQIIK